VNVNPVGVSPSEPSFILQPRPGGTVKSASVSHLSPYGRILCSWRIDEGRLQVSVKIPPNTRARLVLPGKDQVIGSGVYDFTTPYVADPAWPPKAFQVPFLPPVPDEFAE
jgi:alpha-L-rhamnosidase